MTRIMPGPPYWLAHHDRAGVEPHGESRYSAFRSLPSARRSYKLGCADVRLAEILNEQRVTVRLQAEDKRSALDALARLFVLDDPRLDRDAIQRVFEEREALASTGVGSGVAIPHGRLPDVERLVAAVGICKGGVEFEAIDGRPAHILVAVLGPERQTGEHLKALARFSRLLRDERVRTRLLDAADDAAALEILLREDGRR